jgi:hypothetical protein
MQDFNNISVIQLHSDRCGPKELAKLEEAVRRGNKRATIHDYMQKSESNPS